MLLWDTEQWEWEVSHWLFGLFMAIYLCPAGLPHPVFMWWYVPGLIIVYYVILGWCPWEIWVFFVCVCFVLCVFCFVFPEGRLRKNRTGGKGRWVEKTQGKGRRGICSKDSIRERRFFFKVQCSHRRISSTSFTNTKIILPLNWIMNHIRRRLSAQWNNLHWCICLLHGNL